MRISESVLGYLGFSLQIFGILSLTPVFVSWYVRENLFTPYFIPAFLAFVAGTYLARSHPRGYLNSKDILAVGLLNFIIFSLIGSIPFFFEFTGDLFVVVTNSLFEGVAGVTTTGFSNLTISSLRTVLFWRSLLNWIGGALVLAVFCSIIDRKKTWKILWIYSIFTLTGFIILNFTNVGMFNSLILSLSALSTSGFIQTGDTATKMILLFLTIVGATSFFFHEKLFSGKVEITKEMKAFLGLFLFSGIVLFFVNGTSGILKGLGALTTTAFPAILTNEFIVVFLIFLMMIGGSATSTAGGLKLGRILTLRKVRSLEYFFLYVVTLFFFSLLFTGIGLSLTDSFFITVSAQSNVGFTTVEMEAFPLLGKFFLMIAMFLGRLELFPLLVGGHADNKSQME